MRACLPARAPAWQLDLIAAGKASLSAVVSGVLRQFSAKYKYFVKVWSTSRVVLVWVLVVGFDLCEHHTATVEKTGGKQVAKTSESKYFPACERKIRDNF